MNTAEDGLPLPLRYWAILNLAVGMALVAALELWGRE